MGGLKPCTSIEAFEAKKDETEEAIFFKRKTDFDHIFDSEKTLDAINDLLMTTVTKAACPLLAKKTQRRGGVSNQEPCTSNAL